MDRYRISTFAGKMELSIADVRRPHGTPAQARVAQCLEQLAAEVERQHDEAVSSRLVPLHFDSQWEKILRAVDCVVHVLQEEGQRPLVLPVPARGAERESAAVRPAAAHRDRRAERRARPHPAAKRVGAAGVEHHHLRPRRGREAERCDLRGPRLQLGPPATANCNHKLVS